MSKNLGDLSHRVKRRLFEEDKTQHDEKAEEFYDVVDKDQVVAEFLELCDTVDQTEGQREADITPTESAIKRNLAADEKPVSNFVLLLRLFLCKPEAAPNPGPKLSYWLEICLFFKFCYL